MTDLSADTAFLSHMKEIKRVDIDRMFSSPLSLTDAIDEMKRSLWALHEELDEHDRDIEKVRKELVGFGRTIRAAIAACDREVRG